MPYDPNELVPVARVTGTVVTLAVPASMNVGSLKELLATAKQKQGSLNWTTAVTMTDIILEGFLKTQGIEAAHVRYKQPAEAVNDLLSERIQLYSSAYAIVRAQAQGGKVKLLAVQARNRVPGPRPADGRRARLPRARLRGPGRHHRRPLEQPAGRGARSHRRRHQDGVQGSA